MVVIMQFTALILVTMLNLLSFLIESRPLDGYAFPVYTTETCPRNWTEWQKRSFAFNCIQGKDYMCVPNENITELLEFCYSLPQTLILNGSCMVINKQRSIVDTYDCSLFTEGCPNSNYRSQDIHIYQSCVTISNGCFIAESVCERTTETQQLSNSSPTTDNNQTINTTPHGQKPDTGEKDNGNLIGWVVILSVVILIILITFGVYYKRKQTLDSHEENIPLIEIERISWNQPISSPTLETLFGSIGDVILHLSSDRSFADKLLKVAKINEFINEIKMLSSGVELYRKIDTENQTHQPGKVFVYEVKLRCQENELTVIPENPNNWTAFLSANSEDLIKVMNIESRSLHVIPAKLRVYREFKDGIDTGDIFLHHVLEDYDEIAKRSAYKKISSFCDTTLFLKELTQEVLSHIPTILGNAFMHALTKEKISSISDTISLEYDGNKIGTRHSSPYDCDSNIAKKIKGLLEEKIMLRITEPLSFSICDEIEKHLKSHFGSDQNRIDFVKFKKLQPFHKLVKYTLELTFSKVMSSENQLSDDEPLSDDPSITSASSHLLKGATCNVNSITWRAYVGSNIFHKIDSVKDNIISSTEDKIKEICRKTTEELQITHDRLRNFQDEIEIENQTELVETWQKREVVKDKKTLANHPSILNFIAGTKDGLPFIKVLLRHDDESDRLYIRNQSTHSEDTQFEFVDISAKSMELVQMQDKDNEIPLSDDIRSELNNIINSEAEKIYANYSIVSGLGVDNVRYDGNESVNEPCIVIYCLDKILLPYGEKMLPTSLGGYPCDIREGVFMFGNCADCRHKDPDPGCTIYRPNRIDDLGSAGFLVRSTVSKKVTGFLTAAHVAIEDIADLYDERVDLSRCSNDLKAKRHCVIHLSNSRGARCAGKVKKSIIGNYLENQKLIGIDAAYVKSYKRRLGETTEMTIADDNDLGLGKKTRVRKKGQATGLTNGLLLTNNLYINLVDIGRFPYGSLVFNNCYAITDEDPGAPFSILGDSGSGVYLTGNDKPLGIAFAIGYIEINGKKENITVVCRINSFIEECKVTIHNEQTRME